MKTEQEMRRFMKTMTQARDLPCDCQGLNKLKCEIIKHKFSGMIEAIRWVLGESCHLDEYTTIIEQEVLNDHMRYPARG